MAAHSRTEAVLERGHLRGTCANASGARADLAQGNRRGCLRCLLGTGGAQLVEFAFAMPFLVVIVVGVLDFGQAYNVKHMLTNASREAARITVSSPLTDSNGSCQGADPPCSIQAAAEAAKTYLTNAGQSKASCITPATQSSGSVATLKWTYTCTNGVSLTIDRSLVVSGGPNGTVIPSAKVTLSYPYTWTLGRVIGLLPGNLTLSLPSTLTTSAVMQILATG